MKLKRLYKLAHEEDELAKACYQNANWDGHSAIINRRNALIDAIYVHPDNIYTRRAINCQIISGLSGMEHELKAA